MGMWTAITIIAFTALVCGAFNGGRNKQRSRQDQEHIDALQRKVDRLDEELRDRVETLERIVTDRKEDLRRQFDYLDKAS